MLPSMRFYIISIVSIFVALGIGIFIGFTMDTQEFVTDQKNIINDVIESQFQTLIDENKDLKAQINTLETDNENKNEYINLSYEPIIKERLEGLNIGIISTNEDYITSGIGRDLELAGARVMNVTTLNNNIVDKERLNNLYTELNVDIPKNLLGNMITTITESIISGVPAPILESLERQGFIETIGNYSEAVDYLIITGGSFNDNSKRINQVDRLIVEISKRYNIPIIGVEKSNVNYSYISGYKDLGIPTVDNVDMTIGKVAMIFAMDGMGGHYGIKNTAEKVIPYLDKE